MLTKLSSRQKAYDKGLTTKGSQRGSTTNHLQTRGSLAPNDLRESAYEKQHANYSLSITGHDKRRSKIAKTTCERANGPIVLQNNRQTPD